MQHPPTDNPTPDDRPAGPPPSAWDDPQPGRKGRLLCLGVPWLVIVASFLWLSIAMETIELWAVNVHESGAKTLVDTILCFRHFVRELPVDLCMALFLVAAFARCGGLDRPGTVQRKRAWKLAVSTLLGALALAVLGIVATARQRTPSLAIDELFQYYTRDATYAYGSHWRYHLLSTIWFGLSAIVLAPLTMRLHEQPVIRSKRPIGWTDRAPWLLLIVLTCAFGANMDVFNDIRYIGHQAREILTHFLVTCLFGFGVLHLAANWTFLTTEGDGDDGSTDPPPAPTEPWIRWNGTTIALLVLLIAIPGYLGVMMLRGDVMAAGQSSFGLAPMIASHFFEHTLDYALVAMLAAGFYGLLLARMSETPKGDA